MGHVILEPGFAFVIRTIHIDDPLIGPGHKNFTIYYVKVMTDSGPGTATETMTSYAGRIYFGNADFPYASTIAMLTLVLVIAVSTIFMRVFRVRL